MFKIASENSCPGFDHKTEAGPCNKPVPVPDFKKAKNVGLEVRHQFWP